MKKYLSLLLCLITITAIPCLFTEAHPGRTDSNGGHYVRTAGWGYEVGSYHYHNGGPSKNKPKESPKYSNDMKRIQERLNELGYDCGEADGIKGPQTEQAIKNFQSDNGLEPDGIVGPATRSALGI